jgi:CTP synthase
MHAACLEFARNVLNIKDAESEEFQKDAQNPVIQVFPGKTVEKGFYGAFRVGGGQVFLKEGTRARGIYNAEAVSERHRERYVLNNDYRRRFEASGMIVSGRSEKNLAEICELPEHRWFLGVQYFPEFKSRPDRPHPLFVSFIEACLSGSTDKPE